MLEHGGRRCAATRRYGIPEADWLDLSTGINPHGYPVPPISAEDWRRLPEDDDGLLDAATGYYGTPYLVALSGSQSAIQTLPWLLPQGRVAVLAPTYAEHPYHWRNAGHAVSRFAAHELSAISDTVGTVLLCQPNNPDATRFPADLLAESAERLQVRGGHLIVDEAFIDATPDESLITLAGARLPTLIVLRSLGKFFGLAGARVGFVAARSELRQALREADGPWPLSGPARIAARQALANTVWQARMRRTLSDSSTRLSRLLAPLDPAGQRRVQPLFVWLPTPTASALADALAGQGILVRAFGETGATGLRFGLPGGEGDWQRLEAALRTLPGVPKPSNSPEPAGEMT